MENVSSSMVRLFRSSERIPQCVCVRMTAKSGESRHANKIWAFVRRRGGALFAGMRAYVCACVKLRPMVAVDRPSVRLALAGCAPPCFALTATDGRDPLVLAPPRVASAPAQAGRRLVTRRFSHIPRPAGPMNSMAPVTTWLPASGRAALALWAPSPGQERGQ